MNTIQKLAAYRKALERWKIHRTNYQLQIDEKRIPKKPLEHEPLMQEFEIMPDDAWALKIRAEVLKEPAKKSLPPKRKMK